MKLYSSENVFEGRRGSFDYMMKFVKNRNNASAFRDKKFIPPFLTRTSYRKNYLQNGIGSESSFLSSSARGEVESDSTPLSRGVGRCCFSEGCRRARSRRGYHFLFEVGISLTTRYSLTTVTQYS